MRNSLKALCILVVVAVAAFAYAWPYIQMEFAGSAHYTERDAREYDFYTPDILKKMPRITERYDFNYSNITGPAAQVWSINFYGANDINQIDDYLISIGYVKQSTCDIEADCWHAPASKEVVTVAKFATDTSISVQVYLSPYR
ncbi:hypothetical protein [Enterobacillus tribolii]|uniref:Uncharacterized protein n=1 Tax=Enterobacillus tribolii TaxID=1487935 RepID=A0A370QVA9_9GAMM|nr:hypothetical protein [Enterobacillus tribolii]MBW7981090.1 hypothetical protein [Enterobacillus tribolii]RDK92853.1 hypothetical protein C8D90_103246 [Enterobacillus tribolii]